MALVSTLPIISLINCVLCMGVWGSGILGTWIYKRFENNAFITPGQGAVIGGLSGVIAAVAGIILGTIFGSMGVANLLGNQSSAFDSLQTAGGLSLLGFIFNIVIYPFFGAIGGAIGGVVLGKREQ
ncbi:hypothetical protein JZU68_06455 [bacterium]|nr:hypothetical protein [bacterium]